MLARPAALPQWPPRHRSRSLSWWPARTRTATAGRCCASRSWPAPRTATAGPSWAEPRSIPALQSLTLPTDCLDEVAESLKPFTAMSASPAPASRGSCATSPGRPSAPGQPGTVSSWPTYLPTSRRHRGVLNEVSKECVNPVPPGTRTIAPRPWPSELVRIYLPRDELGPLRSSNAHALEPALTMGLR